ncbi:MAG TPA: UdgX family uracil-DNA binding protein [Acidimicrobiales bacterium]|nr:UdgX family uracil-DNA binding protein [Acidimicrobiales bacterium]
MLRAESAACTRCDLYRSATQVVFGEGPVPAPLVLVGEQPGDQEDRQGEPFVGPAGGVLDRALKAAEIDRSVAYVTNAVKHFKWTPRGTRRLHQTPNQTEVQACRPWLEQELELVQPEVTVLMGATAAKAVLGAGFRVTKSHGELITAVVGGWTGPVVATVHPSSILRAPDGDAREKAFAGFVADLHVAADQLR